MARRSATTTRVLCVDPSSALIEQIRSALAGRPAQVEAERSLDRMLERLEDGPCGVLVVTGAALRATGAEGHEYLKLVRMKSPSTRLVFLAESETAAASLRAARAGPADTARLPVGDDELRDLLARALEGSRPDGSGLPQRASAKGSRFETLVGRSPPMRAMYRQIRQAAATDIPVLLTGETGTGKDLAARAIHARSARRQEPYVPVHLGALPQELVASELFGHEKGAFTGALERRVGSFEHAHGGTVFLDEIGTVDEKVQVSLLRLFEKKRFHRIGGRRMIAADVRLIAASNEDLDEAVEHHRFREDLFFRLNVFHVVLPPLRERHGDIPLLVDEFLQRYNREFNKRILGIAPECMGLLEGHDWPGNVRELKNVIQRAVLVCTGEVLLPRHLPPRFRDQEPRAPRATFEVGTPLAQVEREMIRRALAAAANNRTRAAGLLGISRRALYNKLHKHNLA